MQRWFTALRWATIGGLAFGGLVWAFSASAMTVDIDAALTPANKKKLDSGEAVILKTKVDDKGAKVISNAAAMVVVNKPLDQVWPYLVAFDKLPEFIPGLIQSEKYTEKDGAIGIKQCYKVLWKKVVYHVLQVNDEEKHTMTFSLDKTQKNDIAETQGQWVLRPYGEGKTLAVYSLALDTGMPVPRFIQNLLMNKDLPGTMNAVKRRAESDGKYKK